MFWMKNSVYKIYRRNVSFRKVQIHQYSNLVGINVNMILLLWRCKMIECFIQFVVYPLYAFYKAWKFQYKSASHPNSSGMPVSIFLVSLSLETYLLEFNHFIWCVFLKLCLHMRLIICSQLTYFFFMLLRIIEFLNVFSDSMNFGFQKLVNFQWISSIINFRQPSSEHYLLTWGQAI